MPLAGTSITYQSLSSGSTLQNRETSTHMYFGMDAAAHKEDFLAARTCMSIGDFLETILGIDVAWEKANEGKLIAITNHARFKEALESYSQPTNGKESTRHQLFSDLFNLVIQRIEADDSLCVDTQGPALRAGHSSSPLCIEDSASPRTADLVGVIEDVFALRFGKNGKGMKDAYFFWSDLLAFIESSIKQAALENSSSSSRVPPASYKGEPVAHESSTTPDAGSTLPSCDSSVY